MSKKMPIIIEGDRKFLKNMVQEAFRRAMLPEADYSPSNPLSTTAAVDTWTPEKREKYYKGLAKTGKIFITGPDV